jgi:uncharacterized protein
LVNKLFQAIARNDRDAVISLLQAHPRLADARSEDGVSGILFAVYHGRLDLAAELSRSGATVGIHEAVVLGDLKRVRSLIEGDPTRVNAYSPDGFQPLGLASYFHHGEVAKYLLEHGADPNAPSRNPQMVAPIHSAAAAGQPEIVAELVKRGADVNAKQQRGYTALHAAILNRDLETIRILVTNGADCGSADDRGQTPKDLARKENVEQVTRLLRACR